MTQNRASDWTEAEQFIEEHANQINSFMPDVNIKQVIRDAFVCGFVDGMRTERSRRAARKTTRAASSAHNGDSAR